MDDFDVEIFERAAQLVERGWAVGAFARAPAGNAVAFDAPDACSFCALGAAVRALQEAGWWCSETQSVLYAALNKAAGGSIVKWNDAAEDSVEVAAFLRSMPAGIVSK